MSFIIFCFHRISDEHSPAYPPMPVKVFDKICSYLSRKYLVIPLNEIKADFQTKKIKAIITFDDAYYDFYENAIDVLKKYNLPATQHIITSCAETGETFWTQKLNKIIEAYFHQGKSISIEELNLKLKPLKEKEVEKTALAIYKHLLEVQVEKREKIIYNLETNLSQKVGHTPMLTWQELRELNKSDLIEFASHTCSHKNLATLSPEEARVEMLNSKEKIEEELNINKKLFLAYPNGQFNQQTPKIAEDVGYKAAFTTQGVKFEGQNVFQIPRISVYHTSWWKNWIYLRWVKR